MTKKDFELIANVLGVTNNWLNLADEDSSAEGDFGGFDTLDQIVDDFCTELKNVNPRFNAAAFKKAVYDERC